MTVQQHAFFLTANERTLAATVFLPQSVRGAVLFIPPFAEERKGALPAFAQTARALAARGVAGLLFDFTGCGDSSGTFGATPPETFDADCEAALAWLRQAFPHAPAGVLGLRTGAALAMRLAAARAEVATLALWAPVPGADFIRQLLQRRMVNDMVAYGRARESRAALEARLRAGETVDLDGYAISGEFYAWAQPLTLQTTGLPTFLASGGHDEKSASSVADAPAVTRSALRYPPFWNTVGHVDLAALVRETAEWFAARFETAAPSPGRPAAPGSAAACGELADLTPPPTVRAFFDAPTATPRGGVLFLHGWSGDRTGPHRVFVRFARQLTSSGLLCARPDFIGRGLSDGDAAEASILRMTANAQEALDKLRRRLPPDAPVCVVAICSGCKVAIALASKNPGIDRLLLWSAESMGSLRSPSTGLRKTLSAAVTYLRKLSRPETWRKILSGKVQAGLVTQALARHETRSAAEAAWEDGVLKVFRAFRRPVLFVFGGSDPEAPGSSRAYDGFCRANAIPHTVRTIAHAGHSFYGENWTSELLDLSARFISSERHGRA